MITLDFFFNDTATTEIYTRSIVGSVNVYKRQAFHAYGNANTNPAFGGAVYGQYMKTFNINPHSGGNKPEFSQVHGRTLLGGTV